MQIDGHDIGVCSWSLRPKDMGELVSLVRKTGLSHIQLATSAFVAAEEPARAEMVQTIRDSGLQITAGMINFTGEDYITIASIRRSGGYAPADHWEQRRAQSVAAADICKTLGITKLSTHIGFVPISSDPNYTVMVERVGEIAAEFASRDISLLMETGQESASELLQFLNDLCCRNVGINFDPANMILYGAGDPIEAIKTVGRHIWHVHIKDANASEQPGTQWGAEVPFGKGEVDVKEFLHALDDVGYRGPFVIEREAGNDRVNDVIFAIQTLRNA